MSDAYKQAGVDIAAGNEAVERMKKHVQRTFRPEVLTDLGGFGGLFGLDRSEYEEPVLVSGTDGVGTKLMLAFAMGQHDTIGIDAVAMCVNDIVVQGAEPLFFLDYLACGQVTPEKIEAIVKGIADGCLQAGCALIGGETAEMPDMYRAEEYDIAGFAVGIAEKRKLVDGSRIAPGDVVLGLASSGLHSNGYSLVRKLFLKDGSYELGQTVPELNATLGEVLLTPTRIYVKSVLSLLKQVDVKGLSHITGGGLIENIPRVLPSGVSVDLQRDSWPVQPVFTMLQTLGELSDIDLYRTFNMGIGMAVIVTEQEAAKAMEVAQAAGESVYQIGRVVEGDGVVLFDGVSL